jgi:hypothetical protein
MKFPGAELLLAGGASVVAANQVALALVGMPLGGIAACVFGAMFGVLYLPIPKEGNKVPTWVAVPVLAGVGVFGGAGLGHIVGFTHPGALAFVGLVFSAMPVPAVRWFARKFWGAAE